MSKAFTRESDDGPEPRPTPRLPPALPPGTKNYITPGGRQRLQDEFQTLSERTRPLLAAQPESIESKRQLQILDAKILRLNQSIQSAVLVEPPGKPWDQIRFGATVTVRDSRGERETYRIVGIDETDIDRNHVSWLSPIAKALLNSRLGQKVRFKFPSGEQQLEIMGITYE